MDVSQAFWFSKFSVSGREIIKDCTVWYSKMYLTGEQINKGFL